MLATALGALAGCGMPSFAPPPAEPPVPLPVPRPEPPPHRPAAPAPAPAPDPDHLQPGQLTGLDREATLALLGPPAAESTQAMALVWRYRARGCALSLIFYPEVETGVQRVLGYEFSGGGDGAACLNRLRESHLRHGR